MDRHRILIVYDVPGWAYHRRAMALQKYAPPDFEVIICDAKSLPRSDILQRRFDLVFELDYFQIGTWRRLREQMPGKPVPLVVSFNKDHYSKQAEFEHAVLGADIVIINNRLRYDRCTYRNVVNISNGVDTELFRPLVDVRHRPRRVLYTGSTSSRKGKNYAEVLVPLAKELERRGIGHHYLPVDHVPSPDILTAEQMVWWYNTGQVVVCASRTEGTPNIILEGMACGCVPVMTNVGNAPELIEDRVNGVICEPTVASFMDGVTFAVEHAEQLSEAALATIERGGWAWRERSRYFFALFRKAIRDGAKSVRRVSYMDGAPEDVFA